MIQRIQSVFLLLAVLINLGFLLLPAWKYAEPKGGDIEYVSGMKLLTLEGIEDETPSEQRFTHSPVHVSIFLLSVAASAFLLMVIFQYNDRGRQMKLGYVGIVALLIEILLMVLLTMQGPFTVMANAESQPQAGFVFPVIAVIFTWLAIRFIKKDDDLVKSVDRIR